MLQRVGTHPASRVAELTPRNWKTLFDALTQELAPLGPSTTSTLDLTYDAAGRRTRMQVAGQTAVTYGYDNSNRLTSITQGTNAVTIAYDPGNRRTELTMPNNTRLVYGWDDASQLTSLTYRQASPDALLGNVTYTYDLAGRRIAMGGSYARVALPPPLASATYDANNRLTNWAGTTLSYDDNGNLTGDGAFSYTWDSRDRLTGITGAPTSSFAYDPAGRRMTRTVSGSAVGYVYDGWNVVHTHAAGSINATLLNGLGLDERYARTNAGGTVAFLTDALGSTLHLRSPGGANTATTTYEPYGAATSSGSDSTAFGYTGREDDGNGLMYYRNRYYHPRFSRFISEDPIRLAGGLNLYTYVGGDPVSKNDPRGLDNPGMGPYNPPWWYRPPRQPGSGCGDPKTDCIVPDLYPEACRAHDRCYSTPGVPRSRCDNEFWRDMFAESGPWPNVFGPTFYWLGVRLGGADAYNDAQRNAQPGRR